MSLRCAHPRDIPAIVSIHVACWNEVYNWMPAEVLNNRGAAYRERQWSDWFKNPDGALFVAEEAGAILGFCHAGPCKDPDLSVDGEMRAGYILPSYRGGTLGLEMMRTLAEWMAGQSMVSAGIWAFKSNRFRHWYSHLGWKSALRRDRIIADHKIPEVGYVWPDVSTLPNRIETLLRNSIDRAAS